MVGDEAVRANIIVTNSNVSAAYLIHFQGAGSFLGYASETLDLRYLTGIARIIYAMEMGNREVHLSEAS